MSTLQVAKRFRCDICNAQATVDDPDTGKVPDGWAAMTVELYAHGVRLRDFCSACVVKPFGQVISEILGSIKTPDDTIEAHYE